MDRNKRMLVLVLTLNIILCSASIFVIIFAYVYRLDVLNIITFTVSLLFLSLIILLILGSIAIIISVMKRREFFLQKPIYMVIKFLFPLYRAVSAVFKISSETVDSIFTEINNYIVEKKKNNMCSEDLMIIAPHCLQNAECSYKLTNKAENCRHCKKCDIDRLLELCKSYEIDFAVVSGGTSAKRVILNKKPQTVIAIACERDLSSGIRETKIPVIGIPNIRPNGPCYNTKVNIFIVKETIERLLKRSDI